MNKLQKKQDRLQVQIEKRTSMMNTSKWKYLFALIRELDISYFAQIKLILEEKINQFHIPKTSDFINDKYIEEYWGVFGLNEIEWILIPHKFINERKNREEFLIQDIKKLEVKLLFGKKIEFEITEKGLMIYGYR